jgi:diguanylate cyclase (GGDEF)-like protein
VIASAFPLRRFSLSAATWYATVLLGWGVVATGVIQVLRVATTSSIDHVPAFVMTAALAVLLELLPLVQGRGHNPQGVVMSTAFVFAIIYVWGPWAAVVIVAVGSLASDLRARKSWWKVLFNPAQYAISTGTASLVVALAHTHATLHDPLTTFHAGFLLWMVGAWAVYILLNFALVAGVLSSHGTFREHFFEDFRHETLMTLSVLALSPLVMVVGIRYWQLMPLLLIPLVLLYMTAQIALDREHAAGHDALTGLPNRTTLQFELDSAFAAHTRDGEPFALMLIDLNDFKRVNDTLGHSVGDSLLVHFAHRLQASIRPGDCVARLGGDEFAVIVFDVGETEAIEVAQRIRESLAGAIPIDTISLEVNLSLGIALCPAHGVDGTTLLRRADVAMYSAKGRRSGVDIYSPARDENSAAKLELLGELRQALVDDNIELYYQPKVAAVDSRPLGVEALVRWNHPLRGFVPPDEFIPLAERSGVMALLTRRVVELAVTQAVVWRDLGLELPVAVNVSPTDLVDETLVEGIAGLLNDHELDPGMLLLEITERMATNEVDEATRTLDRLRELGVRISLDDFGTGYSSLARLSSLPVDEIKIDRVFVTAMSRNEAAVSIVRTLIDLAHALHLPAIAEGVEESDQWRLLAMLGCDGLQGWHVARPMPAADATEWLCARLSHEPPKPLPTTVEARPAGVTAVG